MSSKLGLDLNENPHAEYDECKPKRPGVPIPAKSQGTGEILHLQGTHTVGSLVG